MELQRTYYNQYRTYFENNENLDLIYNLLLLCPDLSHIDNNKQLQERLSEPAIKDIILQIRRTADKLFNDLHDEITQNVGFSSNNEQTERYLSMLFDDTKRTLMNFKNIYQVEVVSKIQDTGWENHSPEVYSLLDVILYLENSLDRHNNFVKSKLYKYPSLLLLSEIVSDKERKAASLNHDSMSEDMAPRHSWMVKEDPSINDLASLFRNQREYDALIQRLVSENVIYRDKNSLRWRRRKYEIACLYFVLDMRGLLNRRVNEIELSFIALQTFKLKVTDRTMRSGKNPERVKFYDRIVQDVLNNC